MVVKMAVEGCLDSTTVNNVNELRLSRFKSFEMDEPSSPEMFESEPEDDECSSQRNTQTAPILSPIKLSREELIEKSDYVLYRTINKYLSGVPPPPKHTSCPLNCNEMLTLIHQNREYFWINYPSEQNDQSKQDNNMTIDGTKLDETEVSSFKTDDVNHRTLNITENEKQEIEKLKNKSSCSNDSALLDNDNNLNSQNPQNNSGNSGTFTMSSVSLSSSDSFRVKEYTNNDLDQRSLFLYSSIHPDEAAKLSFEEAYKHKAFGIHYNRNKTIEEFERLTIRLYERYIHSDTQSTCNVWFTSSAANNAKTMALNARLKGQSPGKRLNYLTKRRRTFSRANLQSLTAIDKKYRLLNYKKSVMKKGKSPRGKSPRGKSPRIKTPRSSAKKRAIRKLSMDGQSPMKKVVLPKRALFQSPPSEKLAGPSQTLISTTNSQNIKRALFRMPDEEQVATSESRKRKNDEPLDGPRLKWARSATFDCTRTSESNSPKRTIQRHVTDSSLVKSNVNINGKTEMSAAHRKKLLWAVAEALRARGIGMNDSRFKEYAACLARTVKKYMPDLENRNIPRKPGSTTDRMLKLAKHHVYLVIEGKIVA